jgi:3-hydroxyisobutyrate dehydrogenase
MKVGFIGLGHMGGPMSRNVLVACHDLVVPYLRREAAADLEGPLPPAASPRAAGVGRDVVITMLPAGDELLPIKFCEDLTCAPSASCQPRSHNVRH